MPRTMGISLSWAWCGVLLYVPLFLIHLPSLVTAKLPQGYLIANPSTAWTYYNHSNYWNYQDGALKLSIIHVSGFSSTSSQHVFAYGFFCFRRCDRSLLAIYSIYYNSTIGDIDESVHPQLVWSANQKILVSSEATLQLSSERGLVLIDSDGTTAWSTNIGNKSVVGLNLTDTGHLVLLDKNNATIWQSFYHPTDSLILWRTHGYLNANPSTSWNTAPALDSVEFRDGSTVRIILNSGSSGLVFACGLFCNQTCINDYLFAIFVLYIDVDIREDVAPQVVWSANQKNPVSIYATLQLSSERGLVLQDGNGTTVWSANIGTKSVAGLNLTDTGNLMLLDQNDKTIWQSFDDPTDSLLPGQKLTFEKRLTSIVPAKYQIEGGLFSLYYLSEELHAFIKSNASEQYYFEYEASNAQFYDESLFSFSEDRKYISFSSALSLQYMRFEPDGQLRVYEWNQEVSQWKEGVEVLQIDNCDYPTVCGSYGIYKEGYCGCPGPENGTYYFQAVIDMEPDSGCFLTTPLSCESPQHFLELKNVTYFNRRVDLQGVTSEFCKQACLKNCSCKAAFFTQDSLGSTSFGQCSLQSQVFSLKMVAGDFTAYIKVQNVSSGATISLGSVPSQEQTNHGKKRNGLVRVLSSSVASVLGLFLLIGILVFWFRKSKDFNEADEYYLDHVPGMATRYSFEDLKAMTGNFEKKLGGGGFGTVFEGALIDGTKVAIKRFDGFNQIRKSFLAEVETIGNINHLNLVKLIGFCSQKSHMLLVYEYMSNGSLDKWIFPKTQEITLDWHQRKKIILDIAKGLTYLHEECNKKIAHLDVKPENILIDENFNAKVADFGLSKLIDRDQSQVVTTMRGTPGYLAPEWLNSIITVKVDVYSFGVVLLEILCGRRHFDSSQPEKAMHLIGFFKEKLQEKQLLDLVDEYNEDMQLHGAEVVNIMRVAAWCLQNDFTNRPSMSMVVKVLEGVVDVQESIDFNFCNPAIPNTRARVMDISSATVLLDSILSGPR